jgi:hypothetical protein
VANAAGERLRHFLTATVMASVNRGEENSVNPLKQYLTRANEIIGERTPDEEKYDREVIRWMRKGKSINKAIAKANEKYPTEALQVDDDTLGEVRAHYEYLAEHEAIIGILDALKL